MSDRQKDNILIFLKYILPATAITYIAAYIIIAISHLNYPFELEWMEGGSVNHVLRILNCQELYVEPSLDFVPFIYTPLYFYISALVSLITGAGFLPLRLVSFASSLGCFLIIFAIVKRETQSSYFAVLASSLFAASYKLSGAWLDIGRVDSLFLFLLLLSFYLIKFKESPKYYIIAGLLTALSFLTKQTALVIAVPVMAYSLLVNRKYSYYYITTVVIIIGLSTLVLNHYSNGWYYFYTFKLSLKHEILESKIFLFWINDILLPLCFASALTIFLLLTRYRDANKKYFLYYVLISSGLICGSWLSRIHSGGYDNVLMPAYASISITFGLALPEIFKYLDNYRINKRKIFSCIIYTICIIQFAILYYNPLTLIPTQQDIEAGNSLINKMKEYPGDVLILSHGYLAVLAGKKSRAHQMAL